MTSGSAVNEASPLTTWEGEGVRRPAQDRVGTEARHPSDTARALAARTFRELAGLDLRSLAAFRIGLGVLLLVDLVIRFGDLTAHYTDDGLLPREALWTGGPASVHVLGGSYWFEAALFALAAGFALALAAGVRTRLVTAVSWFLLLSLHGRNLIILQGGDILFRLLLFWGMFLPLGARWSVDSARAPARRGTKKRVVSLASVALILQICFVYWFAVVLKSDPIWRTEGTAVSYALRIDQIATPFGKFLLGYPELLRCLTFATLLIEGLGPVLLFVPIFTGPIRLLVVVTFITFHVLGMGPCMELGLFPYICAVAWLALLPTCFWDYLALRRRGLVAPGVSRPTAASPVSPSAAGTPPGRTPRSDEDDLAPESIFPRGSDPYLLAQAVVLGALLYVFLWNVRTLDPARYQQVLPAQADCVGYTLGLDQVWDMFAPFPLMDDGWYVIQGDLQDGTQVDLLRDRAPVCWEKPAAVAKTYPNDRWRKYGLNLYHEDYARYRPYYARYLCRSWDARHQGARQLSAVKIYFMRTRTRLSPEVSTPEKLLLCEYRPDAPAPPVAR